MTPLTPAAVTALAQQAADPPYDPSCLECRRAAGKDAAGTTWQCVGHVYRERDTLRSERDEAREALEVEKTCRDRNWNDLKWVRQALDNECRYSEQLKAALTEARQVLESALPHVGRLWHGPDAPPPAYIEELRARIAAVLAQEEK